MNRTTQLSDSQAPIQDTHLSPSAYLASILRGILPRPEALRIEEQAAAGLSILVINLPSEDVHAIGREGRTIESIRSLFKAYGGLHGCTVVLKVSDPNSRKEFHDTPLQPASCTKSDPLR